MELRVTNIERDADGVTIGLAVVSVSDEVLALAFGEDHVPHAHSLDELEGDEAERVRQMLLRVNDVLNGVHREEVQ